MRFNKISTSHNFTRFILLSMTALALLTLGMLWLLLNISLTDLYQQTGKRQADALVDQMESYLDVRLKELTAQARYPLVVQSVMQPESNIGRLTDFFTELSLQQQKYSLVLLDFENRPLLSRNGNQNYQYLSAKQWQQLEQQPSPQIFFEPNLGHPLFTLITPVFYNGYMEGALSVNIPMNQLIRDLDISDKAEGIELLFSFDQKLVFAAGEKLTNNSISLPPLYQLDVSYRADQRQQRVTILDMLTKVAILLMCLAFIVALIAVYFGRRHFVHPLETITLKAQALGRGDNISHIRLHSNNRELSKLADEFNRMADQIIQREHQLTETNHQLTQSQDQLNHSEKMASVGTLATGIAQDIQQPLAKVTHSLQHLEQHQSTIEKWHRQAMNVIQQPRPLAERKAFQQALVNKHHQQDFDTIFKDVSQLLTTCDQSVQTVQDIVTNLATLNLDAPSDLQLFSLNNCIEKSVQMIWEELQYDCDVKLALDDECMIMGDEQQISQVIINLLINARQAIKQQGLIYIRLNQHKSFAQLMICDNGSGIAPENLKNIFNPSFTTKPIGLGTGLGLSISQGIIDSHGGRIYAKSDLNKGSVFNVLLPLATIDATPPNPIKKNFNV